MNAAVYHLVIFLSCLVFFGVVILTGHDNSPLLHNTLGGLFGGVMGGTGVGAAPLLLKWLAGSGNDPGTTQKQAGYVRLTFLGVLIVACVMLASCASLSNAFKTNPLATACASGSTAIKVLATAEQAGQLNLSATAAVNDALAVLTPACATPIEPSPSQATLLAVNGAVAKLTTLAQPFQAVGTH